jgi:hypothetical protein
MRILAMTAGNSLRLKELLRIALGATLALAVASSAWAQATQNLTIGFQLLGNGPGPASVPVPLSNWATAGIVLLVSLTAFVVLRLRNVRGGRFLGAMVAMIAGASMLGVIGQRAINEAQAAAPVAVINLSISPTLNVGGLFPNQNVTAVVDNTTGQSVQITSIILAPGLYSIFVPTTCVTSLVLAPGATCSIALSLSS